MLSLPFGSLSGQLPAAEDGERNETWPLPALISEAAALKRTFFFSACARLGELRGGNVKSNQGAEEGFADTLDLEPWGASRI